MRTESALKARIYTVLVPRIGFLEERVGALKQGNALLGTVVEAYAADAWAQKSENGGLAARVWELEALNAELKADNAGLVTENYDFMSRIIELEGVVEDQKSRLPTEDTETKADHSDLKSQNTDLRRKNTELETQASTVESENTKLKYERIELIDQNTELATNNTILESELSTRTFDLDAAKSEIKKLYSAMGELQNAALQAGKRANEEVERLKDFFIRVNEARKAEFDEKDRKIAALRARPSSKSPNEASLQDKLERTESKVDNLAEKNAKLEAELATASERDRGSKHKYLVTKSNVEKEVATRTEELRTQLRTANANLKSTTAANAALEKQITKATEEHSNLQGALAFSRSLQSSSATAVRELKDSAKTKNDAMAKQKKQGDAKVAKLESQIIDLETKLNSVIASRDALNNSKKDVEKKLQNANDEIKKMVTDHSTAVVEYEEKLETLGAMIADQDGSYEVSNVEDAGFAAPQERVGVSENHAVEVATPFEPSSFDTTADAFSPKDDNEAEEQEVEEAQASQPSDSHTPQKKRRLRHPKKIAYRIILSCKERMYRFKTRIKKASDEDGIIFDGIDCLDLAKETEGWAGRDIDRLFDIA